MADVVLLLLLQSSLPTLSCIYRTIVLLLTHNSHAYSHTLIAHRRIHHCQLYGRRQLLLTWMVYQKESRDQVHKMNGAALAMQPQLSRAKRLSSKHATVNGAGEQRLHSSRAFMQTHRIKSEIIPFNWAKE